MKVRNASNAVKISVNIDHATMSTVKQEKMNVADVMMIGAKRKTSRMDCVLTASKGYVQDVANAVLQHVKQKNVIVCTHGERVSEVNSSVSGMESRDTLL
jgi:stalled ribosome rescue protein Dom34